MHDARYRPRCREIHAGKFGGGRHTWTGSGTRPFVAGARRKSRPGTRSPARHDQRDADDADRARRGPGKMCQWRRVWARSARTRAWRLALGRFFNIEPARATVAHFEVQGVDLSTAAYLHI